MISLMVKPTSSSWRTSPARSPAADIFAAGSPMLEPLVLLHRELQGQGGAVAPPRGDAGRALQLLGARADDVHPHAASGDLGDLLGGGEAGAEDQLVQSVLGDGLQLLLAEQVQ